MSSSPKSPAEKTDDFQPPRPPSTDIAGEGQTGGGQKGDGQPASPSHPERIGDFRIEKVLGAGGFGCVYLAYDENAQRRVAIKVPLAKRVSSPQDAESYLQEARAVARLEHPAIVPLYHVGREKNGAIFLVSKFISGSDLDGRIAQNRPTFAESAQIIARVAEALHYAHTQGLVHRDIKPANILLDENGRPYVADFGLALKEEDYGQAQGLAGTPAYMSPEQARGEGHLVDGRSDLFGLGVVFYELLTGKRPFRGKSHSEILERIQNVDVQPPRQINDAIPAELERICLKTLSRRAADRYATGLDMADDLNHWQAAAEDDSRLPSSLKPSPAGSALNDSLPPKIIPKGLRSFDENDADFFLELLPGPRDRDGLPESIRFWKTLIEQTDSEKTFRVGLLYGPSGCGKSSLVKAGLLPRLADNVLPIYIEATPEDTEAQITRSLSKHFPQFTPEAGLGALSALRRGELAGRKVLLVLDQFEQWLHAHREEENSPLVKALRQCDGERLQCLVMVRDDFWMAATRFFRALEIALLEGRNIAAADLFEPLHARGVLAEFGRAYGRLPENLGDLDGQQQSFLDQAIGDLTQDGKIICVRLSLLAQMVQGKPWTPDTLKQVGGVAGVGETFLEETFSAAGAPPEHRLHQRAARRVLRRLLPEQGIDIKGHIRSREELLQAAGYASRVREFEDLLRILDQEVRLITPIDPEAAAASEDDEKQTAPPVSGGSYYQLTHDYLVPSLRAWLTRKQKETRRGRAELRLAERAALWTAKGDNRHLPSWWEYGNIRLFTKKKNWTKSQNRMMKKATRHHGLRWGSALLLILVAGLAIQHIVSSARRENLAKRTKTAVSAMSTSREILVPRAIADLEELPSEMVLVELRNQFDTDDESRKLSLAYALAHFGQVEIDFLVSQVKESSPNEVDNFVTALSASQEEAIAALQTAARGAESTKDWRHKARLAILAMHLDDTSLASNMCQLRPDPIQRTIFIDEFWTWHGELAALARQIVDSEDALLRSAVALGVGGVADVTSPAKREWKNVLSNWYQNQPDTATHSAAGWAIRKWKVAAPKIAARKQPEAGNDWHVNSVGMTMLKMFAGRFVRQSATTDPNDPNKRITIKQEVVISHPFLFCDGEVKRRQFQQFVDDPDYPAKEKPKGWKLEFENYGSTEDHPVLAVNWYDAVLFCNWLSHKEGLKPCYERTSEKEKFDLGSSTKEHDAWRLILETDGYRLPTEAEWEYACRSVAVTAYSYGNDESLLDRYAVYRANRTEVPGAKLPNGWGLFDVHGNAYEWCHDWYGAFTSEALVKDPTGPTKGIGRVLRGGSFLRNSAQSLRCDNRSRNRPSLRGYYGFGFRLARTYH